MTEFDAANTGAVDMLAEAREAQWSALSFMGDDAIKLVAPAKVNLFLGVGEKRTDGYHEVLNVMHALALHDNIYMTCRDIECRDAENEGAGSNVEGEAADARAVALAGPLGNLRVSIDMADKTQMLGAPGDRTFPDVPMADNIVFKAVDVLARKLDITHPQEISVRIEKHIPMQAGLGGGSADAAAALVGLAHFWGLSEGGTTLHEAAADLGADVAFFLEGGCALFTGVGEAFERKLEPMKHAVVLVKPEAGVSTAECYAAFDADPVPVPPDLAARAEDASAADEVPLFNNLAPAACSLQPELAEVAAWLEERLARVVSSGGDEAAAAEKTNVADARHCAERPLVLLSGSGSATYAIVDTYAEAARLAGEANARGWWARATSFSSLRALKV